MFVAIIVLGGTVYHLAKQNMEMRRQMRESAARTQALQPTYPSQDADGWIWDQRDAAKDMHRRMKEREASPAPQRRELREVCKTVAAPPQGG